MPPPYARGHVRAQNKDHLIQLSHRRNRPQLQALQAMALPASFDARSQGWIGPVKDQGQCGCHDAATEVLTEKGWTRWEDYDWITPLGTMNPVNGFLEFQPPLQRHEYDYEGPLYYSTNRCIDFALTPNHRMFVRKWNESKRTLDDFFQHVEIQKLGWYAGLPHATRGWAGTELKQVQVGERTYSGDDFLALIALVISDGWTSAKEENKNTISFCCFRDDRQEMVRALAYRLGINEQGSRPGVWRTTDGALATWLRDNAYTGNIFLSPHKHVPALVKVASQRQIEHFLRFFGDQHIQKDGTRRFYSSSRLMIDDLQELLLRIGKRGTIEERAPRQEFIRERRINSKEPDLTLTERRSEQLSLERKKNLITEHYKGKVYCAAVPNGTLVTRRNNSINISGNSCWDFSGTFVVETAYNHAGVGGGAATFQLSEEYTLSCGQNGGCNGDDNTTVLQWAKKTGLPLTKDYGPYQGSPGRCNFQQTMTLYKVDDWLFVGGDSSQSVTATDLIKAAIMKYGCVGCAVAAGGSWDGWSSDPNYVHTGNSRSIDHDVGLVGWDDTKGGGAWIMRNSWGPGWANQGYGWIAYGADSIGTEAVAAYINAQAPPIDWYS